MVDLIVNDGARTLNIADWDLDLAYGTHDGENDFVLTLNEDTMISSNSLIRVDGTDIGGIVDEQTTHKETATGGAINYKGRTWTGMLANKILSPDPGQDHLKVTGPTTQILRTLITRTGLDRIFTVIDSPGTITYRFERYTDAYTGLTKMLATSGLRLDITSVQDTTLLGAAPIIDNTDIIDSDLIDFTTTKTFRRVNHLIGMGEGELKNRTIVHWYANQQGQVSQTQTLFGIDEITQTYDYSNAKTDELNEKTRDKLKELQGKGTLDVTVLEGATFAVGDLVSGRDNRTGITVKAPIVKKIIKTKHGHISIDYQAGTDNKQGAATMSGNAETSSPSTIIQAGKGLTMTGNTINAEVTSQDLQTVTQKADNAAKTASQYSQQIGQAQQDALAGISSMTASSPLTATRQGRGVALVIGAATPLAPGTMSGDDKRKLDGIAEGANKYSLDRATTTRIGGVRPDGSSITVDDKGVITAHTPPVDVDITHPVGSIITNTTGDDPSGAFGGAWHRLPSLGAFTWERTR